MKKTVVSGLAIALLATVAIAGTAKKGAKMDTCGQHIAAKAIIPNTLAEGASSVADMMEAHANIMAQAKDKMSQREAEALRPIIAQHRTVAAELTKTAEMMKGLARLPGAPHEMAKFQNDAEVRSTMVKMLQTEKAIVAHLQKDIAELEAMMNAPAPAAAPSKY